MRQSVVGNCPVTVQRIAAARFGDSAGLETILPVGGVIVAAPPTSESLLPDLSTTGDVRDDGSIGVKIPWWLGADATDRLRIKGRQIPSSPDRVQAEISKSPSDFQPTRVVFPRSGCYSVSGRAGPAELTFVVYVLDCITQPEKTCREWLRAS